MTGFFAIEDTSGDEHRPISVNSMISSSTSNRQNNNLNGVSNTIYNNPLRNLVVSESESEYSENDGTNVVVGHHISRKKSFLRRLSLKGFRKVKKKKEKFKCKPVKMMF